MRLLKGLYVCHPQLIRINYIFHSTAEVRELYFVFRHSKIEYFSLVMAIFFNDCVSLLSFFLFLFFFSFFRWLNEKVLIKIYSQSQRILNESRRIY